MRFSGGDDIVVKKARDADMQSMSSSLRKFLESMDGFGSPPFIREDAGRGGKEHFGLWDGRESGKHV